MAKSPVIIVKTERLHNQLNKGTHKDIERFLYYMFKYFLHPLVSYTGRRYDQCSPGHYGSLKQIHKKRKFVLLRNNMQ